MPLQKVSQGQDFDIPAATYNAFIDAAVANQNTGSTKTPRQQQAYSGNVVLVRNNSDDQQLRFHALAITDVVVNPTDNEDEFLFRPVFSADVPDADTTTYCVLLDSLDPDQIGRAVLDGVVTARVNVGAVGDTAVVVDPTISDTTILSSSYSGNDIVWIDGGVGTATETGEQWAVIRLAARAELTLDVKITGNSSIGDNRWSYTWTEQQLERTGLWQDKPSGLTNSSDGYSVAYNTDEANNSSSGVQGNSIDVDTLAGGFEILPVQGNPVVQIRRRVNCDGVYEWVFSYENAVGGTCPV